MKTDEVTLFIASGCAYCPALLTLLTDRIKKGDISRLEVINISTQPELAQQYNVRSVPWVKIGPYEFEGLQSASELDRWIGMGSSDIGITEYLGALLAAGKMHKVRDALIQEPSWRPLLLPLLGNSETPMQTRIGITALMEELDEGEFTHDMFAELERLTRSDNENICIDALHILSLFHLPKIEKIMHAWLDSDSAEAREIAQEYLEK